MPFLRRPPHKILRIERALSMYVVRDGLGGQAMIDERKIVTHKQAKEFASDSFGSYYGDFEAIWNQLPDAPKYTDAEVDEILARSLR